MFTFAGFPGSSPCHLYLHHDGYPAGAAWRFASAQRQHPVAVAFLAAFLATQTGAAELSSPEQAADAEYRYVVQLLPAVYTPELQVQCWRRLPGTGSWTPRCGPMPLGVFIQRFLPDGIDD